LLTAITERLAGQRDVPADAVTASGSGLDPHISLENARGQALRVAVARNLSSQRVLALVERVAEPRELGLLGEPRVNVLRLNLSLDALR
jgi:K+-transporting ATPase ATPase C chain